jgi:AraC-like DNA-binding protein
MNDKFTAHYGKLPEWEGVSDAMREYLSYCLRHLTVRPLRAYSYSNTNEWILPLRRRENPYFMLFEKGSGLLRLGEHTERLRGGELIVLANGIEHSFTPDPGTTSETTNLHFQALIDGAVDFIGHFGLSGIYRDCNWATKDRFLEISTVYSLEPPGKLEYMESEIRLMLWRIAPRAKIINRSFITNIRIQPVLKLIEQELCNRHLSISQMAAEIKLSPIRLRELFHEQFGLSPIQFLQRARIEYAKNLLCTTDMSVKEIASLCGFNDINFFHRVFRRLTDVTPASLRINTRVAVISKSDISGKD